MCNVVQLRTVITTHGAFDLLYNARFSQEPVTEYRMQEFSMIIVSQSSNVKVFLITPIA